MRGFAAFLRKELREILRTWRIWALPGIVIFFALTGPALAKYTPQLLESLMTEQPEGLVIQLPDPTYVDAYLQWTKNLSQIVLFAVIIMFAGMISAEKRSGTAALVLTKPLSRAAMVLAKFTSQSALLVGTVVVGAGLTWLATLPFFPDPPLTPLVQATAVWIVLGLFFLALMLLISAAIDSQAGAAGLGLAAYLVISILTVWGPAVRYGPAGLVGAPTEIAMGEAGSLLWPIVVTLALTAALVAAAVAVFRRREL